MQVEGEEVRQTEEIIEGERCGMRDIDIVRMF